MIYHATNLIAEAFDSHDVKYTITEIGDSSVVEAVFSVEMGPQVVARFISNAEDNAVAIRIFGLICKIPEAKRVAALEACNKLTGMLRFFKFYLDAESSVNVEADLPLETSDDCVGECCFELFVRIMHILDNEYFVLTDALYGNTAEEKQEPATLLQLLNELRERSVTITEKGEPLLP